MSYCRWASDSDVYTYANVDGRWWTEVTDGRTLKDVSPAACAATLRKLRNEGFRVPDAAIDCLEKESLA